MSEIVNRVAKSPLVTIDLEELYPEGKIQMFDLKDFLFQELVLKEKDFRADLKALDWAQFQGKWVGIHCSTDAIIPNWAFILVATYLSPVVEGYVIGEKEDAERAIIRNMVDTIDPDSIADRPIVIKGCSDLPQPLFAYGELLKKVQPIAKSIMYGEPCSTVPIYKRPKA